jgi:hypothetical protein
MGTYRRSVVSFTEHAVHRRYATTRKDLLLSSGFYRARETK